jgi:hypothetical protein
LLTVREGMAQMPVMQGIFRFARHMALVALVARALVPVGWMPDAHGLTICMGGTPLWHDGASTPMQHHSAGMAMDGMSMADMPMKEGDASGPTDHSHHEKTPAQHGRHDVCPFSAAPHLASVPELPQLALPAVHAFVAATDEGYAHSIWARFTPQSPRAPPLNV